MGDLTPYLHDWKPSAIGRPGMTVVIDYECALCKTASLSPPETLCPGKVAALVEERDQLKARIRRMEEIIERPSVRAALICRQPGDNPLRIGDLITDEEDPNEWAARLAPQFVAAGDHDEQE